MISIVKTAIICMTVVICFYLLLNSGNGKGDKQ